jgi:UDP-3-O-[3-hydroxymyristoyl] N-acetylglucosamine deacetylase
MKNFENIAEKNMEKNFDAVMQHTLKKSFMFKSIGQHTGKIVRICVRPADASAGLVFVDMMDDEKNGKKIPLIIENITADSGCTNVGNIHTVEHIISALSGMKIDNAIIESWGGEMPIGDGSANPFVKKILSAGVVVQNAKRKYLRVLQDVEIIDDKSGATVSLHKANGFQGLECDVKIVYDTMAIGTQSAHLKVDVNTYRSDVAGARSFARIKDILLWHAHGFALGASLKTGIGVDTKSVLNREGLRFANEFARHKILDAVGDLRTCGYPIIGRYESFKGGHQQNNALIKKLLSDAKNFEIFEL